MAEDHFKEVTPDSEDDNQLMQQQQNSSRMGSVQPASLPTTFKPESSPIREALLTKFAKLAPSSSSSAASVVGSDPDLAHSSSDPGQHQHHGSSSSWLRSVKGRIAKTVEEYKQQRHTTAEDLIEISSGSGSMINTDPSDLCILSHSQSTGSIESSALLTMEQDVSGLAGASMPEASSDLKTSQSYSDNTSLWKLSESGKMEELDCGSGQSASRDPSVARDDPTEDDEEGDVTPTPTQQTSTTLSSPTRARKRFTFPSFQSLRSSPAKAESATSSANQTPFKGNLNYHSVG